MRTINNYSSCSIVNREMQAIKEQRSESKILTIDQVQTKQGRKGWELGAALLIPAIIYTIVLILDKFHLIREF